MVNAKRVKLFSFVLDFIDREYTSLDILSLVFVPFVCVQDAFPFQYDNFVFFDYVVDLVKVCQSVSQVEIERLDSR